MNKNKKQYLNKVEETQQMYKTTTKKRTNLSIDANLLEQAKRFEINVSAAAEKGIENAVREHKELQWLKENQAAIEHANDYVRKNGLPLRDKALF